LKGSIIVAIKQRHGNGKKSKKKKRRQQQSGITGVKISKKIGKREKKWRQRKRIISISIICA